jgi:MFS family permease
MALAESSVAPATVPQRWKIAATLAVTMLIAFYDRINLSVALPLIAKEQGWSAAETEHYGSMLIALFYVGFGLGNLLLSSTAARLGPRRSLFIIISLWSLFTALGAWVSQLLALFLASRVLLGLAEGPHLPMMSQLTKSWFPLHERSRANSIWIAGIFIAVITAPMLLVPIMSSYGWRTGFFVLAAGGVLLSLPLVWLQIFDTPETHPRATEAERGWLRSHAAEERRVDEPLARADLLALLKQPAFLLILAAGTLNNIVALGISGWLPTYIAGLSGVKYEDLSYLASLPYASSILGLIVWSQLGDRWSRRGYNAAIGYVCAGILVWLALTADTLVSTLVFLGAGTFAVSAFNACEFAMMQRILPANRVATAGGIYIGITAIVGGGLGPFVVGGIISGGRTLAAVLPIVVVCALASVSLAALGRLTKY